MKQSELKAKLDKQRREVEAFWVEMEKCPKKYQNIICKNKSYKGHLGFGWDCEKCGRNGWDYHYGQPKNAMTFFVKNKAVIEEVQCDLEEG